MKLLCSIVAIALIAGCSSSGTTPVTNSNHPANPDATTTTPSTHANHEHQQHGATATSEHDHDAPAAAQMFECPMHPKVRSTNPEDRCPECGMKINKKVPQESSR